MKQLKTSKTPANNDVKKAKFQVSKILKSCDDTKNLNKLSVKYYSLNVIVQLRKIRVLPFMMFKDAKCFVDFYSNVHKQK